MISSNCIDVCWVVFSSLLYVAAPKRGGRPVIYILNLVNITNDHISETGTGIDLGKNGSKFSAPNTEAGEFVASQTIHVE